MKKLVVLGGGESGVGTALLAKREGWHVFLSDSGMLKDSYRHELNGAGIKYEEGGHTLDSILDADEVVKSPGIPFTAKPVQLLMQRNIPVVSEIEFAARYTSARTICITGSNGKTTTTLLIYHIMKSAGMDVELAGNVGTSMARRIAEGKCPQWFVIELSSFQLDGMFGFKADIALLLNITPDHLDRYDYIFDNYVESKFRIINNQTESDYFIYNSDDATIQNKLKIKSCNANMLPFTHKDDDGVGASALIKNNMICAKVGGNGVDIDADKAQIKGSHNRYNIMAAALATLAAGVTAVDIVAGVESFKGVEHRLETVAVINGVTFINDSKATNVNSAWYALDSMTHPVVWIAGGTDKGNDYSELYDLAREKVKALVCMGVDNKKLIESFKNIIPVIVDTASMHDAVNEADKLAVAGDVVLLSPCCASFDLFKNYEHRGEMFKEVVLNRL